jgi:hypothetical protein
MTDELIGWRVHLVNRFEHAQALLASVVQRDNATLNALQTAHR